MPLIINENLRKIIKIFVPFVVMPMTIFLCDRFKVNYAFGTIIAFLLCDVYFISGYSKKYIGVRRLIVCCVMISLSVVGRFIPLFKPIAVITILTAINLGEESGFLVGAMSILISNFFYGQGPFTPFQMFAFGFIGLMAGYMRDILNKSMINLIIFSIISGAAYSMIMDIWNVLWYNQEFNLELYKKSCYTAIPFILMYIVSNIIFILLLKKPFNDKFARIKLKYGI